MKFVSVQKFAINQAPQIKRQEDHSALKQEQEVIRCCSNAVYLPQKSKVGAGSAITRVDNVPTVKLEKQGLTTTWKPYPPLSVVPFCPVVYQYKYCAFSVVQGRLILSIFLLIFTTHLCFIFYTTKICIDSRIIHTDTNRQREFVGGGVLIPARKQSYKYGVFVRGKHPLPPVSHNKSIYCLGVAFLSLQSLYRQLKN